MIDINGMAHVILTVSQFEKAHRFYSALLPEFGMTKVNDGPDFLYHVGARTAIGIRGAILSLSGSALNSIGWACIISACAPKPGKILIERQS